MVKTPIRNEIVHLVLEEESRHKAFCEIFYLTSSSFLNIDDIQSMHRIEGINPLLACKHSAGIGIAIPPTVGSSNKRREKKEEISQKKDVLMKAAAK